MKHFVGLRLYEHWGRCQGLPPIRLTHGKGTDGYKI